MTRPVYDDSALFDDTARTYDNGACYSKYGGLGMEDCAFPRKVDDERTKALNVGETYLSQ